jgi:hypothetical protein
MSTTTQAKNLLDLVASLEKEQDLAKAVVQGQSKREDLSAEVRVMTKLMGMAQEDLEKARFRHTQLDSEMKKVVAEMTKCTQDIQEFQKKRDDATVLLELLESQSTLVKEMDSVKRSFFQAMTLAYLEQVFAMKQGDLVWMYNGGFEFPLCHVDKITRLSVSRFRVDFSPLGKSGPQDHREQDFATGLCSNSWMLPTTIASTLSEAKKLYVAFYNMTAPTKVFDLELNNDGHVPPPLVKQEIAVPIVADEKLPVSDKIKYPIGDLVDCLDTVCKWTPAQVKAYNKTDNHYLIHFIHWCSGYDAWYPECRIAAQNTHVDHAKYNKNAPGTVVSQATMKALYNQEPYTK